MEKEHWEARSRENEKQVENLTKQVEEARQDWQDALDSIPSGGKLMGLAIVDGIGQVVGAVTGGILGLQGEFIHLAFLQRSLKDTNPPESKNLNQELQGRTKVFGHFRNRAFYQ